MIEYQVCYGHWNATETGVYDNGWVETAPSSTVIDDRTIRIKTFFCLEDAVFYAEHYIKSRGKNDLKWLAYLEIKKCEITTIRKLK